MTPYVIFCDWVIRNPLGTGHSEPQILSVSHPFVPCTARTATRKSTGLDMFASQHTVRAAVEAHFVLRYLTSNSRLVQSNEAVLTA